MAAEAGRLAAQRPPSARKGDEDCGPEFVGIFVGPP